MVNTTQAIINSTKLPPLGRKFRVLVNITQASINSTKLPPRGWYIKSNPCTPTQFLFQHVGALFALFGGSLCCYIALSMYAVARHLLCASTWPQFWQRLASASPQRGPSSCPRRASGELVRGGPQPVRRAALPWRLRSSPGRLSASEIPPKRGS